MISFVYFDVGGVLINDFSDNDGWQQLRNELGVSAEQNAKFEAFWDTYSTELNTIRSVETLRPAIEHEFGVRLPAEYSLLDGFVKRFSANPLVWPIIETVRQRVPIGLLTNMYPNMLDAIWQRGILPDVQWATIMDSSVELLEKPNPELLIRAEKRAGAGHPTILFIDNSPVNIEAAATFGWQTFLYDSSNHQVSCKDLNNFLQQQEY